MQAWKFTGRPCTYHVCTCRLPKDDRRLARGYWLYGILIIAKNLQPMDIPYCTYSNTISTKASGSPIAPSLVNPEYFIDNDRWSQWQSNRQQSGLIILELMTGIACSGFSPEKPIIWKSASSDSIAQDEVMEARMWWTCRRCRMGEICSLYVKLL